MENHDVLYPALQKYYSALKSLESFAACGNFFDDVSSLDTFFSEFRNITFVIQKGLSTEENIKIYGKLRDEYLSGDTLKWFVEVRNTTTKQTPFPLKKALVIDLYLPHKTIRLKDTSLVVDLDRTFEQALSAIKRTFIDELKLVEVFFSARIVFNKNGSDIELYPKIKEGLLQMNDFMGKIHNKFNCECSHCLALHQLIESIYTNILHKNITFVNDYAYEINNDELIVGERVEIFLGGEGSDKFALSEIRGPLINSLFSDNNNCIFSIFQKFIIMHVTIYQQQKHKIMPVFMICYSDNTQKIIPFIDSTKSTYYRNVVDLADKTDFSDVNAVCYCGEYYTYPIEMFSEVNTKPYSERIGLATDEQLIFTMILKNGGEWHVFFDVSKVDDQEYVTEQLKKIQRADMQNFRHLNWLAPIIEKINSD